MSAFFVRRSLLHVLPMLLVATAIYAQNRPSAFGIEPDPRAVESGLYIKPVEAARKATLAFTVTETSGVARKQCPVRGSLPLFRGELLDAKQIRLLDDAGHPVPVQGMATATWPDGAVKFLCIDFLADLAAGETKRFRLEFGTDVRQPTDSPLQVTKDAAAVRVDTGALRTTFQPGKEFCSKIEVGGKAITRGGIGARAMVSEGNPSVDPTEHALIIDAVEVVEQGPVQVTLYLKGSYGDLRSATPFKTQQDKKVARYPMHAFVRLYATSGRMDVIHSFGYNGDENSDFVRRYGLTVPLMAEKATFTYGGDGGQKKETALEGTLSLIQASHDAWSLQGSAKAAGRRLGGWVGIASEGALTVVALRDAWQQWPVSFQANKNGDLSIDIYGGDEKTFLDLRYKGEGFEPKDGTVGFHKSRSMYCGDKFGTNYTGGLGATRRAMGLLKISELVLDFTPGSDPASVGNGQHAMLVPWPGLKRWSDTRAFGLTGYYQDADPRVARAKTYFDIMFDYAYVAHNVNGLFGWVDWPDAPDFGKPKDGRFDTSVFSGGVGWTNGERQLMSYFAHYLMGGSRRALDIGHQTALHTIGIDIEHDGGDDNTGMPHRHNQIHWGDEGGPRQAGWRGWYIDYWLTGNPEMLRSIKELHFLPYGIHSNPSAARWPWHESWSPASLQVAKDEKKVFVVGAPSEGPAFHWMNFMRWQTSVEAAYGRYLDALMAHWAVNPYVEKDGKQEAPEGFFMAPATCQPLGYDEKDVKLPPRNAQEPSKPNYITYYFGTYGGSELVSEWAQLTGSKEAVDVILAFGDWQVADAREDMRLDIRNGDLSKGKQDQMYTSFEAIAPAYALLRGKTHPDRVARWQKAMEWRMFDYPYGSPKGLKSGSKQLLLDDYTADRWHATGVFCYGENGHKIFAAAAWQDFYTLWLLRPAPMTQPATAP